MVSDSDEVIYLKSDGGDSAGDGSKERPFKTLDAAVKKANKRKFIGSSVCYIRLLDDMTLDTDQTISIYHPDLVQTKQFVIQGWDSSTGKRRVRKIKVKNQKLTQSGPVDSVSVLKIYSACTFEALEFVGLDGDQDWEGVEYPRAGVDLNRYMLLNCLGTGEDVKFDGCKFRNFYVAILNAAVKMLHHCIFEKCDTCIYSPSPANIDYPVKAVKCSRFVHGGTATWYVHWNNPTRRDWQGLDPFVPGQDQTGEVYMTEIDTTNVPLASESGSSLKFRVRANQIEQDPSIDPLTRYTSNFRLKDGYYGARLTIGGTSGRAGTEVAGDAVVKMTDFYQYMFAKRTLGYDDLGYTLFGKDSSDIASDPDAANYTAYGMNAVFGTHIESYD